LDAGVAGEGGQSSQPGRPESDKAAESLDLQAAAEPSPGTAEGKERPNTAARTRSRVVAILGTLCFFWILFRVGVGLYRLSPSAERGRHEVAQEKVKAIRQEAKREAATQGIGTIRGYDKWNLGSTYPDLSLTRGEYHVSGMSPWLHDILKSEVSASLDLAGKHCPIDLELSFAPQSKELFSIRFRTINNKCVEPSDVLSFLKQKYGDYTVVKVPGFNIFTSEADYIKRWSQGTRAIYYDGDFDSFSVQYVDRRTEDELKTAEERKQLGGSNL
jgi:hypothetical protein